PKVLALTTPLPWPASTSHSIWRGTCTWSRMPSEVLRCSPHLLARCTALPGSCWMPGSKWGRECMFRRCHTSSY
ncbi:unnamed protein product, partial [Effrenium voratum]